MEIRQEDQDGTPGRNGLHNRIEGVDELEAIDAKRFKPETKLQKVVAILF